MLPIIQRSTCLCRNSASSHVTKSILRTFSLSSTNQAYPQRREKPFAVLDGNIDTKTAEFQNNVQVAKDLESKYKEVLHKSHAGGGEKAIARHVKQHKKLLAEDRVKLLVDDYQDFLELSPIAGHAMEYGDVARAGILGGKDGKCECNWDCSRYNNRSMVRYCVKLFTQLVHKFNSK